MSNTAVGYKALDPDTIKIHKKSCNSVLLGFDPLGRARRLINIERQIRKPLPPRGGTEAKGLRREDLVDAI